MDYTFIWFMGSCDSNSKSIGTVDTFSRINKHAEKARCSFSARGGQTAYAGRLDRGVGMNQR
jgi:hypothetical protein